MYTTKFEFTPASEHLIKEYANKPMSEKKELVNLLTKRASIMGHINAGIPVTPEEKKLVPFGAFCPHQREVIYMAVKLGVYKVGGPVPACELMCGPNI